MMLRTTNRRKTGKRPDEHGFSLTELIIVIVIITIVSTIALMQFGSSRQQFTRQNVAQELKSAFERARFDSVKRRATGSSGALYASVVVNQTSIVLTTYKQDTNSAYSAETKTTNFAGQNINITGQTGVTLPVTVSYNQRGEAIASAGNPVFLICTGTCTFDNDTNANASIVLVTSTGTVNMLPGGSDIPTFAVPPVTDVTSTSGIKDDVTLPTP